MTLQHRIIEKTFHAAFRSSPVPELYEFTRRYIGACIWEIHNVTEESSGGFIDEWVQDKLKEYKIES